MMIDLNDPVFLQRQTKIKQYFKMWLNRDFSDLPTIIAPDCYYQECYGPAYLSLTEIQAWIAHQLTVQTVTAWPITTMWAATDNTVFVEWSFTAKTTEITQFDGLSRIHFNAAGLIDDLREYETTTKHTYPYHH